MACAGLLLAGCGSSAAEAGGLSGSREAVDAVGRLGVDCAEPTITGQGGLPYTSVACVGLTIDWMDDVDDYRALLREDCAATPADLRGDLEQTAVVVGEKWVLRGSTASRDGLWPRAVTPAAAAAALRGTAMTAADLCRDLDAWS